MSLFFSSIKSESRQNGLKRGHFTYFQVGVAKQSAFLNWLIVETHIIQDGGTRGFRNEGSNNNS